jgi:glycosyltransferase involved in cell wall biosynthesis
MAASNKPAKLDYMSAPRQPLSAVIITLNCARALSDCLDSLAFADEILVVDSGSTDGTVELAEAHGARVIQQDWLGFGPQKQFAVEAARHDWVLCVDSDERVSQALRASIVSALAQPAFPAYRFPRCNRFLGRMLRHGEGYPDWSLRLFDRRQARWSDDPVHEKVLTQGAVGRLKGDLLHESAETLETYLTKQNRYTSLAAANMAERGKQAGWGKILGSPLLRFFKFYFLRLGFLDGLPGLIHILIGCGTAFAKYAKLLELRAGKKP